MSKVEKTVFLSYRRTNQFTALAIFKDLSLRGYDVFFDYSSIKSGDFEQIILSQIEARGHFLILLTPSALERCKEPNDWVRREIEHALKHKRNIVPLTFEGFDFSDMDKYLSGHLSLLKNYNALRVPIDYFDAAMDKLSKDFLNIPIDAVLHPSPKQNEAEVQQAIEDAKSEAQPTQAEMTAEECFETAFNRDASDYEGQIRDYSKAIHLQPDFAEAYNNRAWAYDNQEQYDRAIEDYSQSIRLNPDYALAYNNRSFAYSNIGRFDDALHDSNKAIQLKPDYADAYVNRGWIYHNRAGYDSAIQDYDEAIRLDPDNAIAYHNRGLAYKMQGSYDQAMDSFNQAINLNPDYASAYVYLNRGIRDEKNGDFQQANENYQKYVDLEGLDADEVHKWIEANKGRL